MRWCFFLVPLLVCHAQQNFPGDLLQLAKIKLQMAENLQRLPNYTCAETIERGMRENRRQLKTIDTVHLEVALVDHHELYGWPGSNRIAESELSSLVGGTIGNGDFGLLAQSIFLSSATLFTYKGESPIDGKTAIHYDYRMPVTGSGYHLKVGVNEAVVGYHGSVWLNPETLDLMRIDLSADDIPEYLGLEETGKVLKYQRMQIGQSSFLLPREAELSMTDFSGVTFNNRTVFHSCRQYSGESVLSFADPAPEPVELAKPVTQQVTLPDFDSEITLLTPINSDEAAIGDQVRARLERSIKVHHNIIAPKGAILSGRILQLHQLGRFFHIEVAFHSLDFDGGHADFTGRENTVSMGLAGSSTHVAMRQVSAYVAEPRREKGPIVIETSRLKLPRGFLLYLQSRLVKSDK
jgi:hypothetical protein